jgi:hypothetical protein
MVRKISLVMSFVAVSIMSAYGAVVTGFVQDNAAPPNPIAGAIVTLTSIGGGGATVYTDTTSTDGSYRIQNAAVGLYRGAATKAGYTQSGANLSTVTVVNATGSYSLNITMVPRAAGSTISGTVRDSTTDSVIAGAKILLRQVNGIRIVTIDSAVSGARGAYLLDSIAAGTYQLDVSATAYNARTITGVTVSAVVAGQTINIKLLAVRSGKLTGKITADSLRGAAISGATVILSSVPAGGGAIDPIDTVQTDAQGVYLFATVPAFNNYEITASKTLFVQKTAAHRNQTAGTDTVNMFLVSVANGDLHVLVLKRADSAAIAGASVTVTPTTGGTATLGTSGATGFANFLDLVTGNYGINVTAQGFNPGTGTIRIQQNAVDTVKIYLVAGATKMLTGVVTDSVSHAVLANVRIILTVAAVTGGGQLTFVDSTDAAGKYSIAGIPLADFSGTLAATRTLYRNKSRTINIGQQGQADTTTYNFVMSPLPTGIAAIAAQNGMAKPEISLNGTSVLNLRNFSDKGVVSLFSMSGKLLYRTNLEAHTMSIALPKSVARVGGVYLVTVAQNSAVITKQIMLQ